MERFYTINENNVEIILQKDIYPLVSVKKALVNFMEKTYIRIESNQDKTIIQMVLQENTNDLEKIVGEFYNDLLRESLRYNISVETKNLRELIIGRALYTTCIDIEEKQEEIQDKETNENYNLDEIAVNWFDNNQNKEEEQC